MALEHFSIQGINTYINPLQSDGQLIHAVNVTGFPMGGLSKRPGYGTYLGTVAGTVSTIFSFPFQNGTQLYTYMAAGSKLYYSTQGTGAWTQATPGTIKNNAYVGNCIFNNTLGIGDGNTNLWTSTDGINFSQPGSAPVAQYLAVFHNRAYTDDGTTSNTQFSVTNDITNWQNSGTSDSSSLTTTSPGANVGLFVAGDRLVITKNRGNLFNWDDTSLIDMSAIYGPSSPRSIAQIDDLWFYFNQYGIFSFDGATRTLISNPIQRQFYNKQGNGIAGTCLGTAPGASLLWDYFVAVGNTTDDFTGRKITNNIIKYDYQKNQFMNWSFNDAPTAFHSYIDINGQKQLLFGGTAGQVFQLDLTKTSDNGASIPTEAVFLFTYASQGQTFTPNSASAMSGLTYEKKWDWIRLFFNPGDEVNIQYAFANTLTYQHLKWSEAINTRDRTGGFWQVSDGVVEIRFPRDENNMPRSRFLFLRIYDDSDNSQWQYFGCQISATPQLIE